MRCCAVRPGIPVRPNWLKSAPCRPRWWMKQRTGRSGSPLSRRRKAASKEKEGTFAKWYNRFLIAGTVLLIPAALAVGILIWGEEEKPISAGDRTEVSADGSEAGQEGAHLISHGKPAKTVPIILN